MRIAYSSAIRRASLVVQRVKNPLAMRETWVWSLDWEDHLKQGTATHSCILAWRIPWTVLSMGLQRVRLDWTTSAFSFLRETLLRKRQHFSLKEYRIGRSSGPRFEGHACYPPAVSPRAGYQTSLTSVYPSVNKQENTFPHRLVARNWHHVMKGSVLGVYRFNSGLWVSFPRAFFRYKWTGSGQTW